jgi:dihydroxyacetone kinase
MSRFFFNDRKQLVNDAIEGILLSAPHGNLVKLDIDPAIVWWHAATGIKAAWR